MILSFKHKATIVVLIFALLTMSCNLSSIVGNNPGTQNIVPQEYTPGESTPSHLSNRQPGGYYFIDLPSEYTQEFVTIDNHSSKPTSIYTDENGVAVFEDLDAGTRFATVLADEQGRPLSGMEVFYYPGENEISIVLTDPNGEYFPKLLVIDKNDLFSSLQDQSNVIDGLMGVQIVKAEVFTISAILAILAKALIVATLAKATYEVIKLDTEEAINLEDVVHGNDGFQYDCMSPDLITSRFEPGVTMAFLLVPGGKGAKEVTAIIAHGTDLIAGDEIAEAISGKFYDLEKPLLMGRISGSISDNPERLEWANGLSDKEIEKLYIWQEMGECAFVPDLVGKKWVDAYGELEPTGIEWQAYSQDGQPIETSDMVIGEAIVVRQEPEALRETQYDDEEVPAMLPIGHVDGFPPLKVIVELPGSSPYNPGLDAKVNEIIDLIDDGWGGTTYTVIVVDISGSMDESDPSGMTKMEAAKQAAKQMVYQLDSANNSMGTDHQVALVAFDSSATVEAKFNGDSSQIVAVIDRLYPRGGTDLGDGFSKANELLAGVPGIGGRFIILMTDGKSDETLNELRNGPIADANAYRTCVHTVGFGNDADIALLQGIADSSFCGGHYRALDSFELSSVYASAAASATGQNVQSKDGTVQQGQSVSAGSYEVGADQGVLLVNLIWEGSTLEVEIYNPSRELVEVDGNRVQLLNRTPTSLSVLVVAPEKGTWQFKVVGVDIPQAGGERYSMTTSTISIARLRGEEPAIPPAPIPQTSTCSGALPSRVEVGITIQVTTSGKVPKLGIRPQPTLDSKKIFELLSGEQMQVLDGPICANNSFFWYVDTPKGDGWVREGNTEFYFVDPLDQSSAVPAPQEPIQPPPPPAPQISACPGALSTRVQVGMNIRVTTSGKVPKLGIRPQPTLDSKKQFELKSGEQMQVLDGPVCANDSYFWYINSSKGKGWVREGNTEFYFVDPLP